MRLLLAFVTPLLFAPLARPALSSALQEEPARALDALEQRISEERESWLEFRRQTGSDEERAALVEAFPREEFATELRALAARTRGTDLAARAWIDLLRLGLLLDDEPLFAEGLERALEGHVTSPLMAGLALELVYGAPPWSVARAAEALRRILGGHPDALVRAGVLAELALLVGLDDSFGAAGRAEAQALLARIEAEYGDADMLGMTGRQFAAGARHEIEHLRVGQVAPDFERTDQDGVRFELSDYRGRVVLLDFWGFV